jgi:hypothetical protein
MFIFPVNYRQTATVFIDTFTGSLHQLPDEGPWSLAWLTIRARNIIDWIH